MVFNKEKILPIWFIKKDTLVTILQVIKNLDENLKRKIVSIITLRNKKEEERQELIYNSFNENETMDIFEYYLSD